MRLCCLSAGLFQPNRCLFNVRSAFYRQVFLGAENILYLVVFLGPQCKLLGLPVIVTAIKVLLLLLLVLVLVLALVLVLLLAIGTGSGARDIHTVSLYKHRWNGR